MDSGHYGIGVARRYAVNADLIFKWLSDPGFAPDPASALPLSEEARFLPVEIVGQARSAPVIPPDSTYRREPH